MTIHQEEFSPTPSEMRASVTSGLIQRTATRLRATGWWATIYRELLPFHGPRVKVGTGAGEMDIGGPNAAGLIADADDAARRYGCTPADYVLYALESRGVLRNNDNQPIKEAL